MIGTHEFGYKLLGIRRDGWLLKFYGTDQDELCIWFVRPTRCDRGRALADFSSTTGSESQDATKRVQRIRFGGGPNLWSVGCTSADRLIDTGNSAGEGGMNVLSCLMFDPFVAQHRPSHAWHLGGSSKLARRSGKEARTDPRVQRSR